MTLRIDPSSRAATIEHDANAADLVPRRNPAARAPTTASPAVRALVETLGAAAHEIELERRLDEFKRSMTPAYRVGATTVRVSAAFRMIGGLSQESPATSVRRIAAALPKAVFQSFAKEVGVITAGKGTPEQVRRLTQALIDARLERAPERMTDDPARRIRELQWEFGIGVDCSGYTHHAFLASRAAHTPAAAARYRLGDPLTSGLQSPARAGFVRVSPATARAGDVVVLGAGRDGSGHKVIVYGRALVPGHGPLRDAAARALGSDAEARLHLITVDSSWGANGEPTRGGVQRKQWLFDEAQQRWASVHESSAGVLVEPSTSPGPYHHPLLGVFRPRHER